MYICIFSLIYFTHSSFLSIRELIGIITSNYRPVDDNFTNLVILFRSPIFHDTLWTNKVSLSSTNYSIFYICNCIHFSSFWPFSIMLIVEDHKIPMRDRCIKCGDLRGFFPPLTLETLALSIGSLSFDHSPWLFSSCGFHIIMSYEFHSILIFF